MAIEILQLVEGARAATGLVRYLRKRNPVRVSVVCMGREARAPTEEDTLCAEFIRDSLLGAATDFSAIRSAESARKFFDREIAWALERDFELCLSLDRFDFVLRAEPISESVVRLRRVNFTAAAQEAVARSSGR